MSGDHAKERRSGEHREERASLRSPEPTPFLDWYGVWPSHRKRESDGQVWSQDPPQGIELTPEAAEKSAVFFHKEHPWEKGANLHINSMLYTEGRYHLWYGLQRLDDISRSYVCYAESEDGFTWERPELGLCDYQGSTRNNIISEGRNHPLGCVFIDQNAPPAERYKAVGPNSRYFRDGQHDPEMDSKRFKELLVARDLGDVSAGEKTKGIEIRQQLQGATSPDGIHWTNLDEPVFDAGATQLDTHNLCAYDPHEEQYVAYLRGHLDRRRLVRRVQGPQFTALGEPRRCLMPDALDPLDDDIYNPCYTPYPGSQQRYLMFPSIYHRIASTVDVQLAFSRDGYLWTRPFRRPIIDLSYEGGEYSQIYASPNLISAHGDWRLPFKGAQYPHDFLRRGDTYPEDGEYRWATWKPDRLVGLEARGEGRITLIERPCHGRELRLNFRTAPDGWIKAEIVQTIHTPPQPVEAHPGFSLNEAETLNGDAISQAVRWRDTSDLSALKGENVGLRFHLYKAKLFSVSI